MNRDSTSIHSFIGLGVQTPEQPPISGGGDFYEDNIPCMHYNAYGLALRAPRDRERNGFIWTQGLMSTGMTSSIWRAGDEAGVGWLLRRSVVVPSRRSILPSLLSFLEGERRQGNRRQYTDRETRESVRGQRSLKEMKAAAKCVCSEWRGGRAPA